MLVLVVAGNESILTGTDAATAINGASIDEKISMRCEKAKSNCKREQNFRYNSFNACTPDQLYNQAIRL